MKLGNFLTLFIFGVSTLCLSSCERVEVSRNAPDLRNTKPNILIITADDMGFSDLSCYGGEIDTPNLNALAKGGVRFTQFYNTGRACPSKASLLTGLYPHQAGLGHLNKNLGFPGYRGDLSESSVTVAEALKESGYANYIVGKWDVTRYTGKGGSKHNWPLQRGFDRFYGVIQNSGSHYDPAGLARDNDYIVPGNDFYLTDAIAENVNAYLDDHANDREDEPFLMVVPFASPRWPLHARSRDVKRYDDRYEFGWDAVRQERFARLQKLGVFPKSIELTEGQTGKKSWLGLNQEEKAWEERRMEVYAAMVDSMDQAIGRIIKKLKDNGQYENTIILFNTMSGASGEQIGAKGKVSKVIGNKKDVRPIAVQEKQFDSVPSYTRNGKAVRMGKGLMPGEADTHQSYGPVWANVSNTPFKQYKRSAYEGGIASPLIIHWPAMIEAPGRLENQLCHVMDLMPTCLELAGSKYPKQYRGRDTVPVQGISLLAALRGYRIKRDTLFWEHEGNKALREGKWKIVASFNQSWELYDMEKDRSEKHNLAAQYPELTKRLSIKWHELASRTDVFPLVPYTLNRK